MDIRPLHTVDDFEPLVVAVEFTERIEQLTGRHMGVESGGCFHCCILAGQGGLSHPRR